MTEEASRDTVDSLAREHGLELLRFAYLLCGDRQLAEDLLQDVLLALHRRFPDHLPLDNPVGYARRALANTNVSRARRRSSGEVVTDVLPDTMPVDPHDPAERDALWQALRRLPVRQRTVLVLRFYADWTDDDIAAALGARRGTVRSLASRAMVTLRADETLTAPEGGRS
ncbi:SigE family RNA polymerase sigma factor [Jatrophihabitans endophyticus]|uniref:SigE family RNA polymerase sigma factor n=1 Tax=Jatrophihabitans endophyticus TaxID=1206085 RepID=UPI0019FD3E51|nr:SigE family RNA polymerase sigma factor [Jatrophihabitans endophyticus]MBE7187146.1 SigE family RNA polymerase sigma factor [Jatrophihabitans endophyticus]